MNRRTFLRSAGVGMASAVVLSPMEIVAQAAAKNNKKIKLAMVGTGVRGCGMWGTPVVKDYGDIVEFVGICDINPGRVAHAKGLINPGNQCKTYTDFEKMMQETKPDMLIVTTVDATHNQFIIRGLELGADIITEKPMTTDEMKCQAILDAERKSGKKVTVTFNYRYSPHRQKLWEILRAGKIGELTSVDFHWYLNNSHGADYFRRWHRLRENSGTLLVHKASHHFDLLNWWVNSDPESVYATGALNFYGKNGKIRSTTCRACNHKQDCHYFFDITKKKDLMDMYVNNEQYDGYHRDGCVFREDINIYDKMAATIKYASGVIVSYSLLAYSPYEGYRITFNGTQGRLEAWIKEDSRVEDPDKDFDVLTLYPNFGKTEVLRVAQADGHGGGDVRLKDKIFRNPKAEDTYRQSASSRDGAFAILVGIAARKSIESGQVIRIADLTDLKPGAIKV